MYPTQPIQRSSRYASETSAAFSDVLSAQASQAATELPTVAIYRMATLLNQSGTKISHDQARAMVKDAGLQGKLEISSVSTPTKEFTQMLIDRKKDELERLATLSRAPDGAVTQASLFGTSFLTSMLDPVNVGLAFVPVARELKWAQRARQSASALQRFGGRAVVGAIEGGAGAAIIEPLIFTSKYLEQAEYDLMDSFLNITFGTAFGAGLHTGFGGLGDVYRGIRGVEQLWVKAEREASIPSMLKKAAENGFDPDDIAKIADDVMIAVKNDPEYRAKKFDPEKTAEVLTPQEAEEVYRTAVGQIMSGRDVDVDPLLAHFDQATSDGVKVRDLAQQNFEPKPAEIPNLMRQEVERLSFKVGMPDPARLEAMTMKRVKALDEARANVEQGKPLTPEQIEAVRQSKVAQAVEEGLPVPDRFMKGNEPLIPIAQRNRGQFIQKQIEAQRVKQKVAEAQAVEIAKAADDPKTAVENIEQEIAEIEKMSNDIAERLGFKAEDADTKMADELMQKAERWSAIAETAQLCVMRGG